MELSKRQAGILLHPTSFPSGYGIGDLGPAAYQFIDFLAAARQTLWQVLPLVIPDVVGSPYASSSAFAGNWLLISPERMVEDGLLQELPEPWSSDSGPVHYRYVARRKRAILISAWKNFEAHSTKKQRTEFNTFVRHEHYWLHDFALFGALKEHFGSSVPWTRWPHSLRRRRPETLATWRTKLHEQIAFHEFTQWVFDSQWQRLKRYAHARNVRIIGDVPIFVTRDSADTWSNPGHFMLDRLGRPTLVAGVPPDYFSSRGQVWGDPLYDWKRMETDGFTWWLNRFRRSFTLYDIVRLDHFRGYVATWGIRAGSRSSRHGSWHAVPGKSLFGLVERRFPRSSFIAEDLGVITQDVVDLRNNLRFPGVRVLQFGFSDLGSIHALKNLSRRSVVYTGTHDNNTTRGWFVHDATRLERKRVRTILRANDRNVAWKFIQAVYASRANTVITPLQDVLNLGSEARMNTPGTREDNWKWRWDGNGLTPEVQQKLRNLVLKSRRL
ncbi:MAG: 4-alpha-glucanotransferase [Candidatus Kerfeldbacteria bacterium]